MLNIEVLNADMTHVVSLLRPIQRFNSPGDGTTRLDPGAMGCPEIETYNRGLWYRPYIANSNMCGGPNWVPTTSGLPWPSKGGEGLYGKSVPKPLDYACDWYTLGTRITLPRLPSYTYLVYEAQGSNDDQPYRSGAAPAGATPDYPYSAGGYFAFRHPNLTGNFAFVDGHVESQVCTDPTIGTAKRHSIEE